MYPRLLATLLALAGVAAQGAVVEIVHVWPAYREAASFRRLSEFLDGKENSGKETVLRTQAATRDGFYFLTRTKADSAVAGATFLLEVILPGDPTAKPYVFTADVPAGKRVFHLGLTGADWPAADLQPVAWRITVRDAAGQSLGEAPSFLWTNSARP